MRGGGLHPTRPKNLRPQPHPTTRSDRCFYLSQRAETTECFWSCSTEAIQDPASELPRILIPRTSVNKGKKEKKGRDIVAQILASSKISTGLASGSSKSPKPARCCSAYHPRTLYPTRAHLLPNRCPGSRTTLGGERVFLALSYASKTTPNSGCH